jgi:hypothetical protein
VKEGSSHDHLAIAWQYPGQDRDAIPAEFSRVINPLPVAIPVPEPPTDPPTPISAPTEETTSVSSTSEYVDFKTFIICQNGATTGNDDYQPHANSGDFTTCVELIDAARNFESGTKACGLAEFYDEYQCCYTAPANPCSICPDGATVAGDDYWNRTTCSDLIEEAKLYK